MAQGGDGRARLVHAHPLQQGLKKTPVEPLWQIFAKGNQMFLVVIAHSVAVGAQQKSPVKNIRVVLVGAAFQTRRAKKHEVAGVGGQFAYARRMQAIDFKKEGQGCFWPDDEGLGLRLFGQSLIGKAKVQIHRLPLKGRNPLLVLVNIALNIQHVDALGAGGVAVERVGVQPPAAVAQKCRRQHQTGYQACPVGAKPPCGIGKTKAAQQGRHGPQAGKGIAAHHISGLYQHRPRRKRPCHVQPGKAQGAGVDGLQ